MDTASSALRMSSGRSERKAFVSASNLATVVSYVWKAGVCTLGFFIGLILGGSLVGALGLPAANLPQGFDAGLVFAMTIVSGFILSIGLGYLNEHLQWTRRGSVIWMALVVFLVYSLNTAIESSIFSTVTGLGGSFITLVITQLVSCLLCGALIGFLFWKPHDRKDLEILEDHFASRTKSAWLWRLPAAFLSFLPIYYAIGALISPFVFPYYADPSLGLGLALPNVSQIIQVQMIRGTIFALAILPIVVGRSTASGTRFALLLGINLFLLVGLAPLLQGTWLPLELRLIHSAEILVDSLLHAVALVWLLGRKDHSRSPRQKAFLE